MALSRFHAQYDLWLSPVTSAPPVPIGTFDTPPALALLGKLAAGLKLFGFIRRTSFFEEIVLKQLSWTPYAQIANLTGRPAISVPLYWTPQGLPMGVQFVGALNTEGALLQLAAQLEQARPWFHRRPPL